IKWTCSQDAFPHDTLLSKHHFHWTIGLPIQAQKHDPLERIPRLVKQTSPVPCRSTAVHAVSCRLPVPVPKLSQEQRKTCHLLHSEDLQYMPGSTQGNGIAHGVQQ